MSLTRRRVWSLGDAAIDQVWPGPGLAQLDRLFGGVTCVTYYVYMCDMNYYILMNVSLLLIYITCLIVCMY